MCIRDRDIIKQQNRELLIYITCVALLALLLVIALIYIYRQMKAQMCIRDSA